MGHASYDRPDVTTAGSTRNFTLSSLVISYAATGGTVRVSELGLSATIEYAVGHRSYTVSFQCQYCVGASTWPDVTFGAGTPVVELETQR